MSLAGRTISHYKIVEEISRGSLGIVYRATDTRLDRDVALKVLPAELTDDPQRRQRFIREARAASGLEHPNIAVIYDVDEDDGVSFIAMELVRGDKLSAALGRGYIAQSASRAFEIAVEIAEALTRAHLQGIVHHALKPQNVMLTEAGHAKVIDFGLAKLLGGDYASAVAASYLSPEQALGGAVDHRTDVFSFGILLYEMFSNTRPFHRQGGVETMHAILHDSPPPLQSHGVAIPQPVAQELQRIIEKCLVKDPDARYQDMKDLALDLKAAGRHLDSDAPIASAMPSTRIRLTLGGISGLLLGLASVSLIFAAGCWFYSTQ